jgi:hypothetical protein
MMHASLARLYKQHNSSVGSELHCTGIGIDIRLAQVQTHAKTRKHTHQTTHTPGKGWTKIRGEKPKSGGEKFCLFIIRYDTSKHARALQREKKCHIIIYMFSSFYKI